MKKKDGHVGNGKPVKYGGVRGRRETVFYELIGVSGNGRQGWPGARIDAYGCPAELGRNIGDGVKTGRNVTVRFRGRGEYLEYVRFVNGWQVSWGYQA